MKKILNYLRYGIEWEQVLNVLMVGFLFGVGFSLAVKIIL